MDNQQTSLDQLPAIPKLWWLDKVTHLMDTAIRIPGTNIRFGLDAIIGFFPMYGELITYGVSATMVLAMVRHGVSGKVIILMIWNIFRDALIGAIPFIGDFYDIGHRANTRNLHLLKEHYEEDKHNGSGIGIVLLVLAVLIGLFFVLAFVVFYAIYKLLAYMGGLLL